MKIKFSKRDFGIIAPAEFPIVRIVIFLTEDVSIVIINVITMEKVKYYFLN